MKAVLLLAHGTPDSLEDMPEYLRRVRGGREPSPELVEEMRRNYAAIGGRSPLTDITRAQAAALSRELDGMPVFVGMRNWRPFVVEALREAAEAGVSELVAIPMAPQYSTLSVERYRRAVEEARPPGLEVRFVRSWHDHPGLLEAFAEVLRLALYAGGGVNPPPASELGDALASPRPPARAPWKAVIFTAHSLPVRVLEEGDPYPQQVAATAAGVAARAGLSDYLLAYQSASRTEEPWLRPELESVLASLADAGRSPALVAPVGFVCDHTEILFDIDIKARAFARERGLDLWRTESLNTSPTLIRALADLVRGQ